MLSIILLFFATLIFGVLFLIKSKPPNFPPGPISFHFIGTYLSVGIPPHKGLKKLYQKYGKIFSISLGNYDGVVINDLEMIKNTFSDPRFSGRPPLRPFLERSWGELRGQVFGVGPKWVEQRAFFVKVLKKYVYGTKAFEATMVDEIVELREQLRGRRNKEGAVNELFHQAITNTLWKTAVGKRFSYDDPELEDLRNLTVTALRLRSIDSSSIITQIFLFQPLLTKLFPNFTGWTEFIRTSNSVYPVFKKVVDEHRENFNPDDLRDLIDVYLKRMSEEKDPKSSFYGKEGEKSLLVTLLDLFVAGGETASSNLTWGILNLIVHKNVQEKLHEEIDRVIGQYRLPTLSDKKDMPYMDAFIKESLRIASIGALAIMHSTTEEIPDFYGYTLPKGTIVCPNIWLLHHSKDIWGDPENFRPERFLDPHKNNSNLLTVFSKGKRACPGEGVVLNELFLFYASLLQEFNFSRDETKDPPILDPVLAATLRNHNYPVIATLRR